LIGPGNAGGGAGVEAREGYSRLDSDRKKKKKKTKKKKMNKRNDQQTPSATRPSQAPADQTVEEEQKLQESEADSKET
jgi:hypothetical protein